MQKKAETFLLLTCKNLLLFSGLYCCKLNVLGSLEKTDKCKMSDSVLVNYDEHFSTFLKHLIDQLISKKPVLGTALLSEIREERVWVMAWPPQRPPPSSELSSVSVPLPLSTGHMVRLRDGRRKSSIRPDHNASSFAQLHLPFTSHAHCWLSDSIAIITISLF